MRSSRHLVLMSQCGICPIWSIRKMPHHHHYYLRPSPSATVEIVVLASHFFAFKVQIVTMGAN
jgi:hypothetical protein